MNEQLKTLDERQKEVYEAYKTLRDRCGIACPKCGGELSYGKSIYMSSPPKKDVECSKCGFKGRVVC